MIYGDANIKLLSEKSSIPYRLKNIMELIECIIRQESYVKLILVLCSVRLELVLKNIVC